MEIKVVVAATDFSATASVAVRRAAQLCRAYGARLHLVHVVRPAGLRSGAMLSALGAPEPLAAGGAVSHLRQSASRVIAEFDVPIDTHLAMGTVSREIGTLARAVQADLVVIGNSRRGLVAEVLGINTALRVHRRADLPVLAVSSALLRPYGRVLLTADLSPQAAQAAQRTRRFFPEARLILLHACDAHFSGLLSLGGVSREAQDRNRRRAEIEAMEHLRAFADSTLLDRNAILRVDLAHPAIAARGQARELDVDLISLQPTKRWLTSGVTEHLIGHPPCDLLLMP